MKKSQPFDHGIPTNPYNPHAIILGDTTIGKDTWIGQFTIVDGLHARVRIGKGCNIADGAYIISHSTIKRCLSEGKITKIDARQVLVGDYCFIGVRATILMGCTIGHHSVIGAGCVLLENTIIPPYSIVTGIPGRVTGSSKKFLKKNTK